MKVLLVDDEPLAREGLRMMLAEDAAVAGIDEARNGEEAVAAIRNAPPDLVFLDVQMPRMDGFGVIDSIGAERMPPVVFVTAHDQYAIRAFEINAIDYLLKPVTRKRFLTAFGRAKERVAAANEGGRRLLALLETIANPKQPLKRLAVRSGERTILVNVDDVEWFGAAENYVELHTPPATHLLHVPLQTLAGSLDSEQFVRIHRSTIVNVKRIKELRPSSHGQYVVEMLSGARLQSGRTFHEQMRLLLTNPF